MRTTNIVQESQSSRQVGENSIAMSIDEASSVFLMDALGKLYSRPAQAVLREYLSNAIDAHKAKGGTLPPIQITLPSGGSSLLLIRDFGKGMNESEFSTILSRYGASTKRDSNAMIGGFGLGAKSGFAVSDEFFMTSYQKGKGLKVRIFKDVLNQGYIDVVDRFTTSEPDGMLVTIRIPKGNLNELSQDSLFSKFPFFMGYGMDVLDIRPSSNAYTNNSVHNTSVFTLLEFGGVPVGWLGTKVAPPTLYGLVGKVAYKIDLTHLVYLARSKKLDTEVMAALPLLNSFHRTHVIDIPIGSVDIPSAREEITYSERSLKTLGAIICNYARLVRQQIQNELNLKKTKSAVIDFLASLEEGSYPEIKNLTWKGYSFDSEFFKKSEMSYTTFTRSSQDSVVHGYATNIKNFRNLKNLSSRKEFAYGLHRISVDSRADIKYARTLLSTKNIIQYLSCGEPVYRGFASTHKGLFCVIPESDSLSEWIINAKETTISEFEAIRDKEELDKAIEAEKREAEKLKKAAAREHAKQAKIARAQSMLSNFTINNGVAKSLSFNMIDQIFKDVQTDKYYWSEEEVNQQVTCTQKYIDKTGLIVYSNIHFPFTGSDVPNTFTVINQGRANYLIKLRAFLRLFLPENSRVIVLDEGTNMEEFKESYPEVKSAVTLVKESIEQQIKDSSSEVMVTLNAIGDSRFKDKTSVKRLEKFSQALSNETFSKLSEELVSVINRFKIILSSSIASGKDTDLDEKYFTTMVKGFVPTTDFKKIGYSMDDDVAALKAKYPLLMQGEFNKFSPEVVSHMIDYIQMCDKRS